MTKSFNYTGKKGYYQKAKGSWDWGKEHWTRRQKTRVPAGLW